MASKSEKDGVIVQLFGLWKGRGKVAFTSYVKEDIVIPKGAKLLAFKNSEANNSNRYPDISVCYVVEE
tara:strand:+ start:261 stop:464 length:204 start_codon:yes stop_codon:yes gene_type:complete